MSISKTIKEYKKNCIIYTKGRTLRDKLYSLPTVKVRLPEFARGHFTIVNRGGAKAIDERLIKELLSEVMMTQLC